MYRAHGCERFDFLVAQLSNWPWLDPSWQDIHNFHGSFSGPEAKNWSHTCSECAYLNCCKWRFSVVLVIVVFCFCTRPTQTKRRRVLTLPSRVTRFPISSLVSNDEVLGRHTEECTWSGCYAAEEQQRHGGGRAKVNLTKPRAKICWTNRWWYATLI